jgi:hypothetical protein
MEYIFIAASVFLSFLTFFLLLFFVINIKIKRMTKIIKKKQSDNHIFLKNFFDREIGLKEKQSQLRKRQDKATIKIIFTEDNKAYWIDNNIFFVADVVDGKPDFLNSRQVDTENMSKNELDKMLFILDNLRRGNKNERGNSGQ